MCFDHPERRSSPSQNLPCRCFQRHTNLKFKLPIKVEVKLPSWQSSQCFRLIRRSNEWRASKSLAIMMLPNEYKFQLPLKPLNVLLMTMQRLISIIVKRSELMRGCWVAHHDDSSQRCGAGADVEEDLGVGHGCLLVVMRLKVANVLVLRWLRRLEGVEMLCVAPRKDFARVRDLGLCNLGLAWSLSVESNYLDMIDRGENTIAIYDTCSCLCWWPAMSLCVARK